MIINRNILIAVETCESSLNHFTELLGKGDPNFTMKYKDALRYLSKLRDEEPELYNPWFAFIINLKKDPRFLEAQQNEI